MIILRNKIWLTVVSLIILVILIYLLNIIKNNQYEQPEDWTNITWKEYIHADSENNPQWKINIPRTWKVARTNCCGSKGISFLGWTSNIIKIYLNDENDVFGLIKKNILRNINPKDKDGNLVQLNVYNRYTCLSKQTNCSEEYKMENIISSLEKNGNFNKEVKANKVIYKELKENFIVQRSNKIYLDFDSAISTNKVGTAYIFNKNNYFEFRLNFNTDANLNQVYYIFDQIIESFEILE